MAFDRSRNIHRLRNFRSVLVCVHIFTLNNSDVFLYLLSENVILPIFPTVLLSQKQFSHKRLISETTKLLKYLDLILHINLKKTLILRRFCTCAWGSKWAQTLDSLWLSSYFFVVDQIVTTHPDTRAAVMMTCEIPNIYDILLWWISRQTTYSCHIKNIRAIRNMVQPLPDWKTWPWDRSTTLYLEIAFTAGSWTRNPKAGWITIIISTGFTHITCEIYDYAIDQWAGFTSYKRGSIES